MEEAQDFIFFVTKDKVTHNLALSGEIEAEGCCEFQNYGGTVLYPKDKDGKLISIVAASGTEEQLGNRYHFIARITTAGISLHNRQGEFVQVSHPFMLTAL